MPCVGFTSRDKEAEMFNQHMLQELEDFGIWISHGKSSWFAAKLKIILAKFPQAEVLTTKSALGDFVFLPVARVKVQKLVGEACRKAHAEYLATQAAGMKIHDFIYRWDKVRCDHPRRFRVIDTRRLPLRHGSAEVQTCTKCGCWRDTRKGTGSKVKWRADDLDQRIKQIEDED